MNIQYIFLTGMTIGSLIVLATSGHDLEDQIFTFERIIDGDTFVASGKTIRLWGIDAPERDHPVGYAALLYAEALLNIEPIQCQYMHIDRYDRTVMKCADATGDIGAQLVRMGMATDYLRYSKGYYASLQRKAKQEMRGIWKYDNEV
jgi:endonuclease YncB( thermonuclease family)